MSDLEQFRDAVRRDHAMTEPTQPPRAPRSIGSIQQLDDGSIRIVPNAESEEEAAEIEKILREWVNKLERET